MSLSLLASYVATDIATVDHDATIMQAAVEIRTRRIGSLLVEKYGEPVGILTETDIVKRLVAEGLDPSGTRVYQIMTSPILSLDINVMPHEAFLYMANHEIRHVFMTQDGKVVGMLSVRDLLHYFKDASQGED